jgi:eukaryotic-like serine/threonine-protein kinase
MRLSAGDKLGPYEILSAIGAGGMGEVYRARDPRLRRDVAIKRLKSSHGARFEQEARAIAALNHPYICQIYDIGLDYLVMEYVEGQPLRGPMPVDDALRIVRQIAEAMSEAHGKGILHRDLKPGNILQTRTGVKVLDFGLAQLATAADTEATQTLEGTVLGTAAYMSPEQAQGKALDERSDIFSLGAVLYELLSGQRPFTGGSTAEIWSGILRDEPAPLNAPAAVADVVRRCLAKRAADRYASMAELKAALDEIAQIAAKPSKEQQPSIAVLPFANISGDKENEYFSDGLAEDILNALAQVPGLRVIARTSAFAFKGQNTDIRRIANTLGVANILEGSVRKAGTRIRVTAQLVAAAGGSHLWSERYDRELADVFAIQDEIAQAIAAALRVKLSTVSGLRHAPSIAAYEAYLKGRYHLVQRTRTPESLARCKESLEQAIALDPQFALPHSELGRYYENMAIAGLLPARESLPLAREAAQQALDLDPSLPQGHAKLGMVAAVLEYDWKEAERQFRLAMAHDPVPPEVRSDYGMFYLLPRGRLREAVAEAERALKQDPLNMIGRTMLAACLASEESDSERHYRQILELDENFVPALFGLALNLASRGMLAEARAVTEKGFAVAPWNLQLVGLLAGVSARLGEASRVEGLIARLEPGLVYGTPRGLAIFHLLCSETEKGADWVGKAIEQRDPFVFILMRHPLCKSLRASPRWAKLAALVNLPAEAL